MDVQSKREREKETVSLMIKIYCRKKHGGKDFVPTVLCWMLTRDCAVTNVPLWRLRPSVPTAVYIVITQICVRKSGRSCGSLAPG
jgi:hypothetical protein